MQKGKEIKNGTRVGQVRDERSAKNVRGGQVRDERSAKNVRVGQVRARKIRRFS